MTEAHFDDVFDWFLNRRGQRVFIEIGQAEPQTEEHADIPLIRLDTMLGRIENVDDPTDGSRVSWVRFGREGEHAGLHLDGRRFTRAAIHPSELRLWQDDVYVDVSVLTPRA